MLTLDEALALCASARAAASERGVAMSFAVVDAAGYLQAAARMDAAGWVSVDIAHGKAWTAAAITTMTHGRFTPQTGAVPIYRNGTLLGALGASGATGEQDEEVCSAAVTASGFNLTR